jgi:hypothetical protein
MPTSQQTPNGNSTRDGQTRTRPDREPYWVTGIRDYCDDRSGPPIVDETGRGTKCWGRSQGGLALAANDRRGVGDGRQ